MQHWGLGRDKVTSNYTMSESGGSWAAGNGLKSRKFRTGCQVPPPPPPYLTLAMHHFGSCQPVVGDKVLQSGKCKIWPVCEFGAITDKLSALTALYFDKKSPNFEIFNMIWSLRYILLG